MAGDFGRESRLIESALFVFGLAFVFFSLQQLQQFVMRRAAFFGVIVIVAVIVVAAVVAASLVAFEEPLLHLFRLVGTIMSLPLDQSHADFRTLPLLPSHVGFDHGPLQLPQTPRELKAGTVYLLFFLQPFQASADLATNYT
jgi:predicted neutral ceramidase superfamily lipid hydrolase